jgi:hypothetical protein
MTLDQYRRLPRPILDFKANTSVVSRARLGFVSQFLVSAQPAAIRMAMRHSEAGGPWVRFVIFCGCATRA